MYFFIVFYILISSPCTCYVFTNLRPDKWCRQLVQWLSQHWAWLRFILECLVQDPDSLLLLQLHGNAQPGRQQTTAEGLGSLLAMWETTLSFWLSVLAWLNPGCGKHLGSKSANRRKIPFPLVFLCLSLSALQVKWKWCNRKEKSVHILHKASTQVLTLMAAKKKKEAISDEHMRSAGTYLLGILLFLAKIHSKRRNLRNLRRRQVH